jgi:subtilisin family serine protease
MSGGSGRGRARQVGAAALAAGLGCAVLAVLPSQAAEPPDAGDQAWGDLNRPAMDLPPATVTLITGDTVKIVPGTADHTKITVEPRAGVSGFTYFSHTDSAGDAYVVPADVAALVGDTLDPDLFNINLLIRDGYDDARSSALPLIVEYADGPAALPGTTLVRQFRSIDAAAVTVPRGAGSLALVSTLVRAAESRTSIAGVQRILLDGRVHASLDESVPQVGAPEVWDRGFTGTGMKIAIVDGGVDAHHPDLAGRVVAAENFTDAPTVEDRIGHGTHVASIAAGDGAA